MYTNAKVPTAVAAGAGGGAAASGLHPAIWVLCTLVGLFALLMASGAAWRVVPASWRRGR